MTSILISGAYGKMGLTVAEYVASLDNCTVVAGVDPFPREDIKLPFPVYNSLSEVAEPDNVDVIIDFSRASALPELCEFAGSHRIPCVACSTGYTDEDRIMLDSLAEKIPIFQSTNMSLGVNLMIDFLQKATLFFGDSVDIEIIEKHHNTKADAPSGTALTMASAITEARLSETELIFGRRTTSKKREKKELGIHAIRGGTIVGEHEALFIGLDEIFSVSHSAQSRRIYAAGALKAAEFIVGRPPKRYNMQDLLLENASVTHLYVDLDIAMVSVFQIPLNIVAKLFSSIASRQINVDMISQSALKNGHTDIAFSLPRKDIASALEVVNSLSLESSYMDNIAKLSVEGRGMERQAGVAAKVFDLLMSQGITVSLVTTSETKISLCIDANVWEKAANAIKSGFGLI